MEFKEVEKKLNMMSKNVTDLIIKDMNELYEKRKKEGER